MKDHMRRQNTNLTKYLTNSFCLPNRIFLTILKLLGLETNLLAQPTSAIRLEFCHLEQLIKVIRRGSLHALKKQAHLMFHLKAKKMIHLRKTSKSKKKFNKRTTLHLSKNRAPRPNSKFEQKCEISQRVRQCRILD